MVAGEFVTFAFMVYEDFYETENNFYLPEMRQPILKVAWQMP